MTPLEILERRHSVRSFTTEQIKPEIVKSLKSLITFINTHNQGFRFQLIVDDPEPMKGYSASYGAFTNARNYLAAVVDTAVPDIYEKAGFYAEQLVIKGVESGLGTCFVGGTYNSKEVKAQIRAGEKILFIVLFGYPLGKEKLLARFVAKMVHLKKNDPSDYFEPKHSLNEALKEYGWLTTALDALSTSPSSLNKRPVRIEIAEGGKEPVIGVKDPTPGNLIDLGIAKFNISYATGREIEWGNGALI